MVIRIRDDRHMRALTGLSNDQFNQLLPTFSQVYREVGWQGYKKGLASRERKRKPGGGAKGKLPKMEDKLLFVLYYYKVYPTFDAFGTQFGMDRSKANTNLHKLSPILHKTLVHLEMMPVRKFESPEELKATLGDVSHIIIDVTERKFRRSQDDEQQQEHYSGKKNSIR
jgi:hypothetical protein